MGYNTQYRGTLEFTKPLTIDELNHLETILDEDVRSHPEWTDIPKRECYYIDLELAPKKTGLKYNGSEKSYGMHHQLQVVLNEMRKQFPEFGLKGTLKAKDEYGTTYEIIVDGFDVTKTDEEE